MLHEDLITAEFVYGIHLKSSLLGTQDHIFMMEDKGTFHNTKELHHLFVDVLNLNRNDQETKSVPLNIKLVYTCNIMVLLITTVMLS